MATHYKTSICATCQSLRPIMREYFKKPCRDCQSYGKTFPMYMVIQLKQRNDDLQREIGGLRMTIQGLYRWLVEDLKPDLELKLDTDLTQSFNRAMEPLSSIL